MSAPRSQLQPVPFTAVRFEDSFWRPRQETNRSVTLRHEYQMCRDTGRIRAWRLDWKPGQPNEPHIFWDSDLAKWIEAAAYAVATDSDPDLEQQLDEVVRLVVGARQPDGYLNTHYIVVEPQKRWTNLRDCHELYCAGHLMEAAVAHAQATGRRDLLEVLCRYADHIAAVFGTGPGQKRGYDGHPEIELALVKLYRATGNQCYLDLAKYFIDERGRQPHYFDLEARARGEDPSGYWARSYAYCQAHRPLREQTEVVGHAVRAFYLYSAMADVAAETGDAGLLTACRRLWKDVTRKKLYLTGGIGPSAHNEGFTRPFDLPNETAYAETCAAIALVFFAHRMAQIEADAGYVDVLERALYNGVLAGVSLDGRKFFYVNPLASAGTHHREDWFGCACCPPNVARLIASLGGYLYSVGRDALYVHLYAGSRVNAAVEGQPVRLTQQTDYPWDGGVRLTLGLDRPSKFDLRLRIPGWCASHQIRVNGRPMTAPVVKGYLGLRRAWRDGDRVELTLSLPIERILAHPRVAEDVGKVALQRGPLIYCLEQCDHSFPVRSLVLPDRSQLSVRRSKRLPGGVVAVQGAGRVMTEAGWTRQLYGRANGQPTRTARFTAIPYYAWDNGRPGPMTVWLARG